MPGPAAPKFAVIDVETTGFSYNAHHRIIEIGVVLLDSALRPEQHWETLLNPNRDLGPVHVHGIRGRDVLDAPEFPDIADELASLLEGRILVAHNAVFDTGFIASEFGRLGAEVGDLSPSSICTMRLAPHALGSIGRGLDACCSAAGIVNARAHAALDDAIATAQLFGFMSSHAHVRTEVYSRIPLIRPPFTRAVGRQIRALKKRATQTDSPPPSDWIAQIAATMPRVPVGLAEECYLAVLDRALTDRYLSGDEREELLALASALSLDRSAILQLHSRYLDTMTKLALADGVVTDEKHVELTAVATQLGLSRATQALPTAVTPASSTLPTMNLNPGDRVTFTGDMVVPREEWERRSQEKGLDVGGVTKKSRLVISADPDSLSGKAKKARDYAVPIVDEDTFALLLGAMH